MYCQSRRLINLLRASQCCSALARCPGEYLRHQRRPSSFACRRYCCLRLCHRLPWEWQGVFARPWCTAPSGPSRCFLLLARIAVVISHGDVAQRLQGARRYHLCRAPRAYRHMVCILVVLRGCCDSRIVFGDVSMTSTVFANIRPSRRSLRCVVRQDGCNVADSTSGAARDVKVHACICWSPLQFLDLA
jgi:hypothetical protein